MRLTGWQRLWVVFSVLSLVAFIAVAVFMWPKPQIIDPYILDLINQPEKCAGRSEKRSQISNNLPDIDGMELDLNCLTVEKIKENKPRHSY